MDKVIKVSNCQECSFMHYDDDYGYSVCRGVPCDERLIPLGLCINLPHDKVHDLCPLKQGRVIVELENNGDETK